MTASDTPPPLTDEFLDEIRALSELAITQRDDENAPYLDTADSLVLDVPRLLAEVDRLRAELAETRRVADHNTTGLLKGMDEAAAQCRTAAARTVRAETERDALAAKLAAADLLRKAWDIPQADFDRAEAISDSTARQVALRALQQIRGCGAKLAAALGETGGTDA
jgi:hypothetical protein